MYRDVGFGDLVVNFLSEKGNDPSNTPWFVVGSLVNPHDNGVYPGPWQLPDPFHSVVPWTDYPPPPGIPAKGQLSLEKLGEPNKGQVVPLNPDGFPQDNSSLPPTYSESLDDKPGCHYEIALKWGLMLKSSQEYDLKSQGVDGFYSPYPFQLQGVDASAWSLAYNQFYEYTHYLADLQLCRMLQALDENHLAENTIVIFLSDHGEMAGAHGGMLQKWHNAYEETIHVPMVTSSPLINKDKQQMREIFQPTSSIDLLPTLLALSGFDEKELQHAMEADYGNSIMKGFAGADLSSYLKGESEGDIRGPNEKPRPGVFFMSNDMITELPDEPDDAAAAYYTEFMKSIELVREQGYPLESGPVAQPNNLRALCTGDWKIVRYTDPNQVRPDEWELYCLTSDPIEGTNLVDFRTGEVRDDVSVPGMTRVELKSKNRQLQRELARQEAAMLGKSS